MIDDVRGQTKVTNVDDVGSRLEDRCAEGEASEQELEVARMLQSLLVQVRPAVATSACATRMRLNP